MAAVCSVYLRVVQPATRHHVDPRRLIADTIERLGDLARTGPVFTVVWSGALRARLAAADLPSEVWFRSPANFAAQLSADAPPSALLQRLAWTDALVAHPDAAQVLGVDPSVTSTAPLAAALEATSETLRSGNASFASVVADPDAHNLPPRLLPKWLAAARIEAAVAERLTGVAESPPRLPSAASIALITPPEITPRLAVGLAASGLPLHTFIPHPQADPAANHDAFDDFGVPTAAWVGRPLPLDLDRLTVVRDLAEAVAVSAAHLSITPNAALISAEGSLPPLLAARMGFKHVDPAAGDFTSTAFDALLDALIRYATDRSVTALADLVRHPDAAPWFTAATATSQPDVDADLPTSWWLGAFDTYRAESCRPTMDIIPPRVTGAPVVAALRDAADALVAPLRDSATLFAWPNRIAAMLDRVYPPTEPPRAADGPRFEPAARALMCTLADLAAASTPGELSGTDILRATRAVLAGQSVSPAILVESAEAAPPRPVLGWLDALAAGPGPLLITGVHEGTLPSRPPRRMLLAPAVSESLGLATPSTRAARDRFVLGAVLEAHPDAEILLWRAGADGTPNLPSRLLVTGDPADPTDAVHRWQHVLEPRRTRTLAPTTRPAPPNEPSTPGFPRRPLHPASGRPRREVYPVTAFARFLRSPYEYYLRHTLRLGEVRPPARELDPMLFGNLMHEVLERFGRSEFAVCDDAGDLNTYLEGELASVADVRLGLDPPVSVQVQLDHARARLRAFATRQAELVQEGWRLIHAEQNARFDHFDVDGTPVSLVGRLDRIDRNERTGAFRVLDYKTADTAADPKRCRTRDLEWRDLQLPLYRHLAAAVDPDAAGGATIELGYFPLSADPEATHPHRADWTDADLASADDAARDVIRRIRAGRFDEDGYASPTQPVIAALLGIGIIGGEDAASTPGDEP